MLRKVRIPLSIHLDLERSHPVIVAESLENTHTLCRQLTVFCSKPWRVRRTPDLIASHTGGGAVSNH